MPSFLVVGGGMQKPELHQAFQQGRDGTTMVTCDSIAGAARARSNE